METKTREKLNLTVEEARDLVYGDHPGFKEIENEIVDQTRWSIVHLCTVQRLSDGKFFQDSYSTGATEQQYERPFENDEPNFTEVFRVEKVTYVYE